MYVIFGRPFVKRFALCYWSVVLSVCLSVTFVHCGQTVGRIKMKLGMQIGLGPGDFVLDGDPAASPQRGAAPQFSAHVYCGQMAGWMKLVLGMVVGLSPADCVRWGPSPLPQFSAHFYCGQTAGCIKMPLGMEVGLSLGDFGLDRDPAPSPKREAEAGGRAPSFGPWLLWPNGWMDEGGTWLGGRPLSSPHSARWGHSSPPKTGGRAPQVFGPSLLWPNGWMHQDATWYGGRPRPT